MDNGYLPLGMGPIPVAPCPKGAPFPTPMPGGRLSRPGQSSGTYGGYGVNPFHTGAGAYPPGYAMPPGQYGYHGYQNIHPGYAPGGYYGHGAMNSLVQRGYYPTARPGRTRKRSSRPPSTKSYSRRAGLGCPLTQEACFCTIGKPKCRRSPPEHVLIKDS
ncbi:unnamed protein product [Symbiodinium sp. CCMP2456]|nr:unnamed protein product [Symbiodinium sp. CCMP2456]